MIEASSWYIESWIIELEFFTVAEEKSLLGMKSDFKTGRGKRKLFFKKNQISSTHEFSLIFLFDLGESFPESLVLLCWCQNQKCFSKVLADEFSLLILIFQDECNMTF